MCEYILHKYNVLLLVQRERESERVRERERGVIIFMDTHGMKAGKREKLGWEMIVKVIIGWYVQIDTLKVNISRCANS